MAASPVYTVYVISDNTKYNISQAVVSIDRAENDTQIAQSVNLQIMNVSVGNSLLFSLLKPASRLFIYANDGSKEDEVHRGFLWTGNSKNSLGDKAVDFKSYDNLIYFQESEESLYFTSGKLTKDIMSSICSKWGIKLEYSYESITHPKLPLRGKLADIFAADILDPVKKRTGKKYVILSDKDVMHVKTVGSNTTIYHFIGGQNVKGTTNSWTMEGVITQVVIVGKADSDEREPIEATVSGNTSEYGTLQKIQDRDENTTLANAKLEAKNTIDENGAPKWEYGISGPDVPWIRKGDKIYVSAGDITGYKIITAIDRSSDLKKSEMSLTLEDV